MKNDGLSFALKLASGFVFALASGLSGYLFTSAKEVNLDFVLVFCSCALLFLGAIMLNDVSRVFE